MLSKSMEDKEDAGLLGDARGPEGRVHLEREAPHETKNKITVRIRNITYSHFLCRGGDILKTGPAGPHPARRAGISSSWWPSRGCAP